MVCGYWALGAFVRTVPQAVISAILHTAFVIGAAIPQIQTITGLIAAIAIMQFTYTFPPLLRLGYDVITDAMGSDELYSPGKGTACRIDTWRDWSRWKRVRIYEFLDPSDL